MIFYRFEDPWFLLLLLLLPLLAWRRKVGLPVVHYSSLDMLKATRSHRSEVFGVVPNVLKFLAMALFIVAFGAGRHHCVEVLVGQV